MIFSKKVHFDTALNCAWLLLGTVALASTFRAVRHAKPEAGRFPAWLQLVGVASVVLALFPYISATDDVLRIAHSLPRDQQSESRTPSADVVRLYETADAPLISEACVLTVTFFLVGMVFIPVKTVVRRSVPRESGRSPPAGLVTA